MRWEDINHNHHGLKVRVLTDEPGLSKDAYQPIEGTIVCQFKGAFPYLQDGPEIHAFAGWYKVLFLERIRIQRKDGSEVNRCMQCWETYEKREAPSGRCPFCFPRVMRRVRPLLDEELEEIIQKGCPDCKIPWAKAMGVYFCEECGVLPPTHRRFQ